ncbi:hypothetical protein [Flavobacterium sp. 245]|uniref:hypothetical protein n=1 Tax=Flavobacterium sp. 245 TaxID=2512115 RepID=UPI00105E3C19|nr:hypothetical protein [Flavobacterium sp. 245]TDP00881.1 hypothetical protein EV145_105263 [Flavobacterium sp. 245]
MKAICTIITGNYGHYALALHDSICNFNATVSFFVFVSEGNLAANILDEIKKRKGIYVLTSLDLQKSELTKQVYSKYENINQDALRWTMKPIVMSYLLQGDYESVIYVDWDIHFFSDFNFLFDELKKCNVLLSPHWRCSDPNIDLLNFKLNFLDGIYNGGFIGASKAGSEALEYWAKLCIYKCEVNRNEGFYVDQRYLDILSSRFEKIHNITHKGCNVANWNVIDCKRVKQSSGEILINDNDPIVFIHFTNSLFKGAYLWKNDEILIPYIEKYRDYILRYSTVDVIQDFLHKGINIKPRSESIVNTNKNNSRKIFRKIYKKIKKIVFKN